MEGATTGGSSKRAASILFVAGLLVAGLVVSSTANAEGDAPVPDLARGEQLFQLCTQCHGANGGGMFAALAPGIAGLPEWYLDGQLTKFKTGVRGLHPDDAGGLRMYPMSRWLRSDSDQKSVAAYIASLPTVAPENALEEHGNATAGAGAYAVCSACHGADAAGNAGMGAPPLKDFADWYLYSSITKYKAGIRGSGPGDALGAAMIGMAGTLASDAAIRDVIAHIQTLGGYSTGGESAGHAGGQ